MVDWKNLKPEPISSDPPNYDRSRVIALAVGAAARILVKFEYTEEQSIELMRTAWHTVQK